MKYTLRCSKKECTVIKEYTNKRSWYNAKRNKSMCLECQKIAISKTLKRKYKSGELTIKPRRTDDLIEKKYFRNCPDCGKSMGYISNGKLKESIKRNTVCNSCSGIKYKKQKYRTSKESVLKMRATKAGFSSWEEYLEKYPKKQQYKREVWKLTYRQPVKSLPNWNKRGRCGVKGAYQLDHIISIAEGWEKSIPAKDIANMSNLRMIPWKENLTKSNSYHE